MLCRGLHSLLAVISGSFDRQGVIAVVRGFFYESTLNINIRTSYVTCLGHIKCQSRRLQTFFDFKCDFRFKNSGTSLKSPMLS